MEINTDFINSIDSLELLINKHYSQDLCLHQEADIDERKEFKKILEDEKAYNNNISCIKSEIDSQYRKVKELSMAYSDNELVSRYLNKLRDVIPRTIEVVEQKFKLWRCKEGEVSFNLFEDYRKNLVTAENDRKELLNIVNNIK